jgi:monofunctional biosynthetic peptidoglycan transglycosylase
MAKSTRRGAVVRTLIAILLLIGLPVGGLALYWIATFPDVSTLAKANPSTTAFMQSRAKDVKRPTKQSWIWMPLSRISPHLQRAVIAAEDSTFYRHEGFDWEGIKAALTKNFEAGAVIHGGSTITQQLAKNLYLTPEKTLVRKIKEALIARSLERHLTKRRILELYLNVVEWGRGIYGAEAAARHHFGKPALELTAEEAALLAAVLPAPRHYDPIKMTRYLSVRQQQILRRMARAGKVSAGGSMHRDSPL